MLSLRKTAVLILAVYLFTVFSPGLAFAEGEGSAPSAMQSAANALSILAPSAPDAAQAPAQPGQTAVETGDNPEAKAETSLVNETLTENAPNLLDTKGAPGATVNVSSPRLDPREVSGSSMYNNMYEQLKRFGVDFFAQRRANPLDYAPVGPNYVVAPGDEVKVDVWGYNEIRANLVVNRDGMLALPQAGSVAAAGLTFSELQNTIKAAYKRIITDFEIAVTMGKLHTINVYVTGHAAQPGAYAVSSMSTLVDVLSLAGGPSLSGSMRTIEVKRNNKRIALFDVYSLLLKGNRTGDIRLAEGDVVFVPSVGTLVAASGNVKRPAVYEVTKTEKNLNALIALAGGLTSGAYKGRIQVVRVMDNTFRTALESDLTSSAAKALELQDGDLLKVFAVPGGAITARIEGAVVQPGVFPIDDGVTSLSDVLMRAGGLLYTAAEEAELTRVEVSPNGPVTTRIWVNVKDVMSGKTKFTLKRDDYLIVRNVPGWDIYKGVTVNGRVNYPGSYAVTRGERLSSLLERSGGYAAGAFAKGAVFMRGSVKASQQITINDMVSKLEREVWAAANYESATALKPKDVTAVQAVSSQREKYIEVLKKLKASGRMVVSLPDDYRLIKGSPFDIELQEGDVLHIPEHPGTVQVVGSVVTPSTFVYRSGYPVTEYIKMAGGFSSLANIKRTYIQKADGSTAKAFAGNRPAIVEEGDFVVVPEKVIFPPTMRNMSDIVDVVYKMVLGISAIDYVFK